MRAGQVLITLAALAVATTVIGCGAGGSTDPEAKQTADQTPSISTEPTTPPTTSTAAESATTSPPAPITISTVLQGDSSMWTEPELLGSIESTWMGVVVAEGRKLVHFEETGETFEGCEGEAASGYRLVLSDFDTGQKQVLIPRLTDYDQSIELGPHDRFALLGGCDANAWLAAVGTLSGDGTIEIARLESTPDQPAVHGSNNAGVSMTWSSDGQILYFNTASVDATTGDLLDSWTTDELLLPHAQLADGSKLVSHLVDSEPTSSFWLLGPDEPQDTVPDRPPLFNGEALYPSAEIELSSDGEGVAVTLDRWSPSERTFLVTSRGVTELAGFATLTSDWSRALVRTIGQDGAEVAWTVVDLASGVVTVAPIEVVPGIVQEVAWAGNQNGLLIAASPAGLQRDTSLQIWYTELTG